MLSGGSCYLCGRERGLRFVRHDENYRIQTHQQIPRCHAKHVDEFGYKGRRKPCIYR